MRVRPGRVDDHVALADERAQRVIALDVDTGVAVTARGDEHGHAGVAQTPRDVGSEEARAHDDHASQRRVSHSHTHQGEKSVNRIAVAAAVTSGIASVAPTVMRTAADHIAAA